jgi:hypothetical protein
MTKCFNCDESLKENLSLHSDLITLQEELSALKEKIRWIPIDERLPEREQGVRYSQVKCLVIHNDEIKILVFNHEHGVWDDESGDDFYCYIQDVSHWRKLLTLANHYHPERINP